VGESEPTSTAEPTPPQSVVGRQNEPTLQPLLRAISVAHARAQRLDGVRTGVTVLVATSALLASFAGMAATPVAVIGAGWTIVYSVGLASWVAYEVRRAAVLQEMFDVRVFGLPWNEITAGDAIEAQEVSRLARRHLGDERELRDYYELPPLPRPYDVIAAQQQNLAWGSRVRSRYGNVALAVAVAWPSVGVVIGLIIDLTIAELVLRWFVPSLALIIWGCDTYRGQREVVGERHRVLVLVHERLRASATTASASEERELLVLARRIQDVIFHSRRRHARVPAALYRRYRSRDRADFVVAMEEIQALLHARGSHAETT
jgi:hypothetical protein